MPRTDFTIFQVANAPIDVKLAGALTGVPGTHRLRHTVATPPLSGESRYQRNGVSKSDCGVAMFGQASAAFFHPGPTLLLRVAALPNPATCYRMKVIFVGASHQVEIHRIVGGVAILLLSVAATFGVVREIRFMVVGATLQVDYRAVGDPGFTLLGTVIDPSPIAGPGGLGFGMLATAAEANGGDTYDVDNWREFDAS